MSTRYRQDELIRLLRRRETTTVANLTEQLGVSRRTILRDVADLRTQGFDIQSDAGPGGGLYLDPNTALVFPELTSAEVIALLVSIAVLKQIHAVPFTHLADAGLKKIEHALPKDRMVEMRRILSNVYIGQPDQNLPLPQVSPIDSQSWVSFETGFLNSVSVFFSYTDRNGVITQREAEPHALLVLSPAWYMVGYDHGKSAFRHFRMDRMTQAKVIDKPFRRRKYSVENAECPFSTSFI